MWNMIGLFSQKRDVNSFCNVTPCCIKHYSKLCKFLQFLSGVGEVFILLECGAASLDAYQYAILDNVMCMFVYVYIYTYKNICRVRALHFMISFHLLTIHDLIQASLMFNNHVTRELLLW